MVPSISCPKCHESWIPAPNAPTTSRVCPSCRRVPPAPRRRGAAHTAAVPPPTRADRTAKLALIAGPLAVAALIMLAMAVGVAWRSPHSKHANKPRSALVAFQVTETPQQTPDVAPDPVPIQPAISTPAEPIPVPVAMTPETIAEPTPIAEPAPPAVAKAEPKPEEPAPPAPFRRRKPAPATDDLLHQLARVKEVDLDAVPGGRESQELFAQARKNKSNDPHPMPTVLLRRSDLIGLPMRMGEDCHLGKESAEALQTLSRTLRTYLGEASQAAQQCGGAAARGGVNPSADVKTLKSKIENSGPCVLVAPEAVPTLTQILQAEDKQLRLYLVQLLERIKGPAASQALANRAVFDVSDEVREAAVAALRKRDAVEYRDILVAGLRHPWPAAAEFAAEALVNLKDASVLPALIDLLDQPPPNEPFVTKVGNADAKVIREMVRVNHLRNCVLCHAPSMGATD